MGSMVCVVVEDAGRRRRARTSRRAAEAKGCGRRSAGCSNSFLRLFTLTPPTRPTTCVAAATRRLRASANQRAIVHVAGSWRDVVQRRRASLPRRISDPRRAAARESEATTTQCEPLPNQRRARASILTRQRCAWHGSRLQLRAAILDSQRPSFIKALGLRWRPNR